MAQGRRDHLIDTALTLFNREGYRATGIDRILAEAGVAKMTLYNHFRSKDELILAALRRRDERFRNGFMRAVERRAKAPRQRLLACFDALGDWFEEASFHGCMFINAAAEYGQEDDPVHQACGEHKRLVRGYLTALAKEAGAGDPAALADQLMLLLEGAIVMRHVAGDRQAAVKAKTAGETLVAAALD